MALSRSSHDATYHMLIGKFTMMIQLRQRGRMSDVARMNPCDLSLQNYMPSLFSCKLLKDIVHYLLMEIFTRELALAFSSR